MTCIIYDIYQAERSKTKRAQSNPIGIVNKRLFLLLLFLSYLCNEIVHESKSNYKSIRFIWFIPFIWILVSSIRIYNFLGIVRVCDLTVLHYTTNNIKFVDCGIFHPFDSNVHIERGHFTILYIDRRRMNNALSLWIVSNYSSQCDYCFVVCVWFSVFSSRKKSHRIITAKRLVTTKYHKSVDASVDKTVFVY